MAKLVGIGTSIGVDHHTLWCVVIHTYATPLICDSQRVPHRIRNRGSNKHTQQLQPYVSQGLRPQTKSQVATERWRRVSPPESSPARLPFFFSLVGIKSITATVLVDLLQRTGCQRSEKVKGHVDRAVESNYGLVSSGVNTGLPTAQGCGPF